MMPGLSFLEMYYIQLRVKKEYSFNKLQVSSPEDIQRIVQTIVEATAKIIVVFSSDVDLSPLILELVRHNVTNRTWIASEAWITSALINQPGVSAQSDDDQGRKHIDWLTDVPHMIWCMFLSR